MVLAFLAGWLVLARSPIGMRVYALGGDPQHAAPGRRRRGPAAR